MAEKLKVHGALLAVNVIYGLNFNIALIAMPQYIQPFAFVLLRVLVSTLLFWLVVAVLPKERIDRQDIVRFVLCGLAGVATNQLLFFKGLSLTSPINSALIMITTPIIVLILAFISGNDRVTWLKIVGVVLGAVGASLIILVRTPADAAHSSVLGDFYILLNAVAYAIYLVIVKPLMKKYHPMRVIAWVFLFGGLFVFPFGVLDLTAVQWGHLPSEVWLSILFVIIFTTFLAYGLNIFALSRVSPSVVGIYIYLQPILAALIAILVYQESIGMAKILAAMLVFLGVFLVSYQPKEEKLA
ncbi:MAG: DMT family transporter [Chitinophagales bacterium]|nr:DMT family transporter [Chitinophagales bacterium]